MVYTFSGTLKSGRYLDTVDVTIVLGNITDVTNVDCIVNFINNQADMTANKLSAEIRKRAGSKIYDNCPNFNTMMSFAEVFFSQSGNLPCKLGMLHCFL